MKFPREINSDRRFIGRHPFIVSFYQCELNVISSEYVSGKEAGLNLALYLSNTFPEWWKWILMVLIVFLRKVLLSILSILKKNWCHRFNKSFLFSICSFLFKKALQILTVPCSSRSSKQFLNFVSGTNLSE